MNGTSASLKELRLLAEMLGGVDVNCDVLVCPPATLVSRAVEAVAGSKVAIGGQDCHWDVSGAHTGDVSAEMLRDCGCLAVISGHSERRTDHQESDTTVQKKAAAAISAGLTAIVCIGETLEERKSGSTLATVSRQLTCSLPGGATPENTVIAYEPVWAIGTGLTPTVAEVAEVHTHISSELNALKGPVGGSFRILYGGSVKPQNAVELMSAAHVNGALVGGASLKATDFMGIIRVYL
jgi:triosephosphate isomerase